MVEPDPPASLRQIRELGECVAQASHQVDAIKSPHVLHREQVAALRNSVHQIWAQVLSQPTPQQGMESAENATLRIGGEINELERKHAETIDKEVEAYKMAINRNLRKLCIDMIDVVGRSFILEVLELPPKNADEGHVSSTDASTDAATDATTVATTIQESQASTQETKETQLDVEPEEDGVHQSDVAQDQAAPISSYATRKRRAPTESSFDSIRKRSRTEKGVFDNLERTIEFEDVFQNGKASIKYIMVSYNNEWYIVRCDKHGLTFKDNPLMAGGKHLNGRAHGKLAKTRDLVIEHLGVHVLNCNAKLAEKNNKATREAFRNGYEPPKMTQSTKDKTTDSIEIPLTPEQTPQEPEAPVGRHGISSQRHRKKFEGITDPVPGDIYRAYWPKDKAWHAVLVLPGVATDRSVDIGLSGTIQDLGLTEQLPSCYVYSPHTGVLDWKDGYKDGGDLVTKRQFPVMYFDGLDFPSKSAVGWVSADDLELGNVRDKSFKLIPNYQSALRFLNAREKGKRDAAPKDTQETEPEQRPREKTPDPTTDTAEAPPLSHIQEEEVVKLPDSSNQENQPNEEKMPVPPPKETATETGPELQPSEKSLPRKDTDDLQNEENLEQVDIVTISSSSPISDCLDFDETSLIGDDPKTSTSVPLTSGRGSPAPISVHVPTKYQPVSVEEVPDESEIVQRNKGLMKTAADCLRINEWYKSQQMGSTPKSTPEVAPQAMSSSGTPEAAQYIGGTWIPDDLMALMRERKTERLRNQSQSQPPTNTSSSSPHQERPLSSNSTPSTASTIPPGQQSRPPPPPPRRASVMLPVPRDLNMGVSTAPSTYQLSSLSTAPPNANNPHNYPQPPLASPSLPNPQSRGPGSGQPTVTLPPITIPKLPTGPVPYLFHHSPSSAPPHPAPSQITPPSARPPGSPFANGQGNQMYLGNETGSDIRRLYICSYCSKRYTQLTWMEKHMQNVHPEVCMK